MLIMIQLERASQPAGDAHTFSAALTNEFRYIQKSRAAESTVWAIPPRPAPAHVSVSQRPSKSQLFHSIWLRGESISATLMRRENNREKFSSAQFFFRCYRPLGNLIFLSIKPPPEKSDDPGRLDYETAHSQHNIKIPSPSAGMPKSGVFFPAGDFARGGEIVSRGRAVEGGGPEGYSYQTTS